MVDKEKLSLPHVWKNVYEKLPNKFKKQNYEGSRLWHTFYWFGFAWNIKNIAI